MPPPSGVHADFENLHLKVSRMPNLTNIFHVFFDKALFGGHIYSWRVEGGVRPSPPPSKCAPEENLK